MTKRFRYLPQCQACWRPGTSGLQLNERDPDSSLPEEISGVLHQLNPSAELSDYRPAKFCADSKVLLCHQWRENTATENLPSVAFLFVKPDSLLRKLVNAARIKIISSRRSSQRRQFCKFAQHSFTQAASVAGFRDTFAAERITNQLINFAANLIKWFSPGLGHQLDTITATAGADPCSSSVTVIDTEFTNRIAERAFPLKWFSR